MNTVYCPGCAGEIPPIDTPAGGGDFFKCTKCFAVWVDAFHAAGEENDGIITEEDLPAFDGQWSEEDEVRRARYLLDRVGLALLDACEDIPTGRNNERIDAANALASAACDIEDYRLKQEPLPCPVIRPVTWVR